MSRVTDAIVLGSKKDAVKAIAEESVEFILNVSDKCFYAPRHDKILFDHVPMDDFGKTELSDELVSVFVAQTCAECLLHKPVCLLPSIKPR